MDIQQVYWSERYYLQVNIESASQPLAFFTTQHESRNAFWQMAKKRQAWKMVTNDFTIYFTADITERSLIFTNLLIETAAWEWSKLVSLLDSCTRYFFKRFCTISIKREFSFEEQRIFLKHGYESISSTKISKEMHYRTALVLGGGGAHGAYQIGVWKALKEEDLFISIVTGTSVGALNGALIVQDQLEVAIDLWNRLKTNQVFALSDEKATDDLYQRFLYETRQMTKQAMIEGGASIAPLETLVEQYLDVKKIKETTTPSLYTVATKIPEFLETVTQIQALEPQEIADWILASASFFPAMAYRQIGSFKYVDGGYRNNLPVDVAVKQQATEVFIVDIQGPGVTKKIKQPDTIVAWTCCSKWSLGSFLIFDSQRNQLNIQLGYLEAKKQLGVYQGNWYTFDSTKMAEHYWQQFLRFLVKEIHLDLSFFYNMKFWQELRNVYKDRVEFETCGLAMLESLAKRKVILPNKVYQVEELMKVICEASSSDATFVNHVGQLNAQEWHKYRKYQRNATIDHTKEQIALKLLKQKKQQNIQIKLNTQAFDILLFLYLAYLKEEQPWHKNSHTKS